MAEVAKQIQRRRKHRSKRVERYQTDPRFRHLVDGLKTLIHGFGGSMFGFRDFMEAMDLALAHANSPPTRPGDFVRDAEGDIIGIAGKSAKAGEPLPVLLTGHGIAKDTRPILIPAVLDLITGEPVDERPMEVRLADEVEEFTIELIRPGEIPTRCATCAHWKHHPGDADETGTRFGSCEPADIACVFETESCERWTMKPDAPDPETCSNCVFWIAPSSVTSQGRCANGARRNAAQHIVTEADFRCGHWEAKPAQPNAHRPKPKLKRRPLPSQRCGNCRHFDGSRGWCDVKRFDTLPASGSSCHRWVKR
jgi:hypothetical protein